MTYQTRTILRRTLPIVFWLLAVGGAIGLPFLFATLHIPFSTINYWFGFLVAALLLVCLFILSHIDRHESSAQENYQVAVLLGIASYWLPTIVFATIPVWIFCALRFAFSLRAFLASLLGYLTISVHAAILIYVGWIDNVWAHFFSPEHLWAWIPTGAVFLAWLGTTIVQRSLRER